MSLEIIVTGDGSHSLFNRELNETYHSTHGAVQESKHVFIAMGFDFALQRNTHQPIRILEIGFGTGLNAWLTCLQAAVTKTNIHYTTLETFPLPAEIWQQLKYAASDDEKKIFQAIHDASWNAPVNITTHFTIQKQITSIQEIVFADQFDLIYFDAFAPTKQPEMWEASVFRKICNAMPSGGVLVTYCAKGQVKRDLRAVGFDVTALPGPPGKREMIRAVKV